MLFAGLGSVRIVENCDLGHEKCILRRRSQFHYTDLPAGK